MMEKTGDPWSNFSPEQIENLRRAEKVAEEELAGFDRWLLLGSALSDLQHEAMRRSNSQSPQGRRYGDMWEWLVQRTPHLARIPQPERSDAIWLHSRREAVLAWHQALPPKQRDRLRTPRVIKRGIERDQGKAKPSAEEISKEPEIKKRGPGIAAAIDEAVVDLRYATDELRHTIGGASALVLDLTPEGMLPSVETFVDVYGGEPSLRFAAALLPYLDRLGLDVMTVMRDFLQTKEPPRKGRRRKPPVPPMAQLPAPGRILHDSVCALFAQGKTYAEIAAETETDIARVRSILDGTPDTDTD
jgi:hypothetical protein